MRILRNGFFFSFVFSHKLGSSVLILSRPNTLLTSISEESGMPVGTGGN